MKNFLFLSTLLLAVQALPRPRLQNGNQPVEEPGDELVDEELDDGEEPDVELTLEPQEEVVTEDFAPGQNGEPMPEDRASAAAGPIALNLDAKWEAFYFRGPGSISPQTFTTDFPDDELIQITDVQCKGDAFTLVIDGVEYATTYDVPATCDGWTPDPDEAYEELTFSSGSFLLPSGHHVIEIKMAQSPFGGGQGFIRAKELPERCYVDGSPYVILTSVDIHAKGERNCQEAGDLAFADVTTQNIEKVSEAVYECIGPYARAWIKSWYGNTFDTCLAIHLGPVLPGASVNVPASCEEPLPTVCEALIG